MNLGLPRVMTGFGVQKTELEVPRPLMNMCGLSHPWGMCVPRPGGRRSVWESQWGHQRQPPPGGVAQRGAAVTCGKAYFRAFLGVSAPAQLVA